jgi:hypothetical protein
MNLDQLMLRLLGVLTIVSALLTAYVHPGFVWLSVVLGLHMLQMGFTGFCLFAKIAKGAGVKPGNAF